MESWLRPMLCGTADVVPEGPAWILEGKLDGWRAVAHREPVVTHGIGIRLYCGRNGARYDGMLPYIERALYDLLPPDSAVDGALVGRDWNHVQSVMTRGGGAHRPSRALPALTYVGFDVTRLARQVAHAHALDCHAPHPRMRATRNRPAISAACSPVTSTSRGWS